MATSWTPTVLFQPVVDLLTGEVLGYEALGRVSGCEDEGFRLLALYAEHDNVYDETLIHLTRLAISRGAFRPPGTLLFINVTRPVLQALLDDSGHRLSSYDGLVFEIPESDHQISQWPSLLVPFVADAAQVALDDWGAGQADPLRLVEIHPAWVKIDLQMTQKVGQDPAVDRLIALLVNWLEENRARVIAEGIETEEQLFRLRRLGIRYGQGYFLGRPGNVLSCCQAIS
ncbi:EAL domain-containing protein [Sulfobacillus harzensis]|uniref:EAL domain-containing protein n=1 Tax=Sulfobacillus harzensis TaxID=2729629 RepID=A0A7Y0Q3Y8_9FIRM|nr:EAL domain-containing protein [Sulfobacillus harzensis]NMP23476.1 EAL domain-containing protein [Sulfobacillus harzensis]